VAHHSRTGRALAPARTKPDPFLTTVRRANPPQLPHRHEPLPSQGQHASGGQGSALNPRRSGTRADRLPPHPGVADHTRKHAHCDTAVVRLRYAPGALRLAVEDEGNAVTQDGRRMPEGHGIVGMRERVAALGGRLTAGPRPEGGYRVFAELPLRAAGIEGS
jgi:hypothetical protein